MSKNEHRKSISGQDEHQADHEQPCSLPAQNRHASFLAQLAHRHSVQNFGMLVFGIVPVCQLCQYWRASFLALRQCASCAKMLARRFSGTVPVRELRQYWHASFVALCQCASCAKILARKFLARASVPAVPKFDTPGFWHCGRVPAVPKCWHACFMALCHGACQLCQTHPASASKQSICEHQ